MIKEVLDKQGLKHFNDTVNERLKNRLKYKGKFTLIENQENWDKLAPTHIGDTYLLAGTETIDIEDVSYKAGEWVVAMNETRLDKDNKVIDESGAETHVKVEKLGSASLPDAEDDGDGLAFVDGEWVIQKNYGYYKPEINKYEFNGKLPPAVMPIPIAFSNSRPLILGNKYKVTINDSELGDFIAEEKTIFDETSIVLNINTDGWRQIEYSDGALRLAWDTEHANENVAITIEGEFEGEYHKFDKRYIEPELPEDAEDADAMVYQDVDGKGWITTPWYAYYRRGIEEYEDYATFQPYKNKAILEGFGDLIHGQKYSVKINDLVFEDYAYDYGDKMITLQMGIGDYQKIYSRDGLAYLVMSTSGAETKTVHVEITGERLGSFRTFDQHYIDGMADGIDNGDGLAYHNGKWEKQPGYGYYEAGPDGYYRSGYIVSGRTFKLVDFPGLVENQRYKGHIGGNQFSDSYVVHGFGGYPQIYLDNGWNRLYQGEDGEWYVEASSGYDFDGNEVDVLIQGTLIGDYNEFDRRYIPTATRIFETQNDIPSIRDSSWKTGDIIYVRKDTTNVELSYQALRDDAYAAGWLMVPSMGLEIPHSNHYVSWPMISALSEEERAKLIVAADGGTIYRAVLTDGTVKYGFYYLVTEGRQVNINDFASKTVYIYDRDTDSFTVISSDIPTYDKHTPIECNFITDLADNLFDE